jgi:hypothetical protein
MSGRKRRTVILWLARLVLFAYAFQLTAIDHWHRDVNDVVGVEGSSAHTSHCHGSPSSCAEQPGLVGSLAEVELTPLPPAPLIVAFTQSVTFPGSAFVSTEPQPPQSS